jgi:hypothetical protein
MKNLENGTEFIWPKEKFLNRLYLMKEMYNNYEEEEDDWDLPEVFNLIWGQCYKRNFVFKKD